MAFPTLNIYSTEYAAAYNTVPRSKADPNKTGYKHSKYFSYTQSGAGGVGDVLALMKIPAGSRILLPECAIWIVGGPATTVLDFGFLAYTEPDGDAVAADQDGLAVGIDIGADGLWFGNMVVIATPDDLLATQLTYVFNAKEDVTLTLTVRTAALADLDVIQGYVTYVNS